MSHSNTMWASQSYLYKKKKDTFFSFFLVNWVFVRIFFFFLFFSFLKSVIVNITNKL